MRGSLWKCPWELPPPPEFQQAKFRGRLRGSLFLPGKFSLEAPEKGLKNGPEKVGQGETPVRIRLFFLRSQEDGKSPTSEDGNAIGEGSGGLLRGNGRKIPRCGPMAGRAVKHQPASLFPRKECGKRGSLNLSNFLRRLPLLNSIEGWPWRTLQTRSIRIGE